MQWETENRHLKTGKVEEGKRDWRAERGRDGYAAVRGLINFLISARDHKV